MSELEGFHMSAKKVVRNYIQLECSQDVCDKVKMLISKTDWKTVDKHPILGSHNDFDSFQYLIEPKSGRGDDSAFYSISVEFAYDGSKCRIVGRDWCGTNAYLASDTYELDGRLGDRIKEFIPGFISYYMRRTATNNWIIDQLKELI